MSWKSGSLGPPQQSLSKRGGVLRRSENNPSLNGSILDDNSVVEPNKRESQWWKRLNSEDKNSTADFFPISNKNIDLMESQINTQSEESMEYQSNEEDEVNFSTISSLNLSLSTRPLFKKGGQRNPSPEMSQNRSNLDNQKIVSEKILFKHKVSDIKTVNYNRAILSSDSPNRLDLQDENDDNEILNEPKKRLFGKSETRRKNGKSVFADALSNHSASYASETVEHNTEDTVTNIAKLRPKKSLFEKAAKKNIETMSVFAEVLVNESDLPISQTIENASENFLKSILSGEEKKQKLFKMTKEKDGRTEKKKSIFAEALSDDYMSDKSNINENPSHVPEKSGLHSVNEKSEKSQEIKKNLFKNANRKNVDGKSVFAQAIISDSEFDTVLDLPEPDLKKQKFSENAASVSNTNMHAVPRPDVDAAEQVENIYSSKTRRKSLLMKSRRQSENDGLSMKSENSLASDTTNFDMWCGFGKQVAFSTMMESPKTPRRNDARASRNLLPARMSLMHPDISEEKDGSNVSLHPQNDAKATELINEQTIENVIQPSCKNGNQSAIINNLIPKETTKIILSTSMTPKESIDDENNTSVTRKSKRISKKNDSTIKSSTAKDLGVDEMEEMEDNHPSPVRNAKQLNEPSHLIERDILDVESPNTENLPQPHTFEMSKRQSVGTWLKLQESESDTVPILNQSYIDKQFTEEIMAKRTNPPVRRSTYENVEKNNSTTDRTVASDGDVGSPISDSEEKEIKKYTVRHSSVHNLVQPMNDSINETECLESLAKTIAVTPPESPIAAKDVTNKNDFENKSIIRNDESRISSSNLNKIANDSKKDDSDKAVSTEAVNLESELRQISKSLSDDENSNDENIFTPRNDPKVLNVQIDKDSTIHDSEKSTLGSTKLNESGDTSHTKNTEKSTSIHRTDTSQTTNDSEQDSESDDNTSEELFDGREDLAETKNNFEVKNFRETMTPILMEESTENSGVNNHSQNSKKPTKIVSTSSKTVNNKENALPTCISQSDIKKHLEKLQHENVERKKKAEEFSTHFLAKKIFHLKPSAEKNKLSFKRNINYAKRTALKDIMDQRETGMSSKKKKNKSKSYLKEQWITSHLRSFVERKLEPRYGFKTNIRSEKFIKDLVQIVRLVEDAKSDYHRYVDTLKSEMAGLAIAKTHFEFYRFIQTYLPYSFRIRSVPACGRSVPNLKEGLFTEIVVDGRE